MVLRHLRMDFAVGYVSYTSRQCVTANHLFPRCTTSGKAGAPSICASVAGGPSAAEPTPASSGGIERGQ